MRNPRRAILLTLALALVAMPGAAPMQDADPPRPAGDEPDNPRTAHAERVIVRVNRNREVAGYVQWEDDEYLLLRKLDGEAESFSKARLIKVVRLVEPKSQQAGVVYLRNGQKRLGVVLEDGFDAVSIEIDGIQSTLPRETVDFVLLQPTFQERYEQYRAAARTPRQQQQLCQWLVDEHQYVLAKSELMELLRTSPLIETQKLLRVVEAQLAMQPADRPVEEPDEEADDLPPLEEGRLLPILSHDDVNLIRVFEINFDKPPRVQVKPETIRSMIELYGTSALIPAGESDQRRLYRSDPLQIVELMFNLRARELYPSIEVLSEPYALNLFRLRVHNAWLMNNCATARCHGSTGAGRFFLHRRRYKDKRVRYTNLLILHRLELDPDWPLVNYDEPEMSLIIQHGLPRHQARNPHPDVAGWKPVFGRGDTRLLEESVGWIEAMLQPRPHYPIDYEPPQLGPPVPLDDEEEPESPFGAVEGGRVGR